MATDFARIGKFVEGAEPSLLPPLSRPPIGLWTSGAFKTNLAVSKAFALLLAQLEPRDLLTASAIDTELALAWENKKEFHHFFPKRYLSKEGLEPAQINVISNIIYLTSGSNRKISSKKPSAYLAAAKKVLGDQYDLVLASNLIGPSAHAAAMDDNYDGFREERGREIDAFAASLAHWSVGAGVETIDLAEGGDDEDAAEE